MQNLLSRNNLNNYIALLRLDKPTGFMLLFWPCMFGYGEISSLRDLLMCCYFLISAILMRGVGCIINDIVDIKYDKYVERTKNRPIASGKISIKSGVILGIVLSAISFIGSLLFLPLNAILVALASVVLIFIYPFAKRFTYFPQVVLGIVFNIGVIIGSIANNSFNANILLVYAASILWTIGYDTIYAMSDIKDDKMIGVKSTTIFFGDKVKYFVFACYIASSLTLLLYRYIRESINIGAIILFVILLVHMMLQLYKSTAKDADFQEIFKSNIFTGLIIWLLVI